MRKKPPTCPELNAFTFAKCLKNLKGILTLFINQHLSLTSHLKLACHNYIQKTPHIFWTTHSRQMIWQYSITFLNSWMAAKFINLGCFSHHGWQDDGAFGNFSWIIHTNDICTLFSMHLFYQSIITGAVWSVGLYSGVGILREIYSHDESG